MFGDARVGILGRLIVEHIQLTFDGVSKVACNQRIERRSLVRSTIIHIWGNRPSFGRRYRYLPYLEDLTAQ